MDEPTFVVVVEPVRLDGGSVLHIQAPHVPPFYLLTAKSYRDKAEPLRLRTITSTRAEPDGSLRPHDAKAAFDAIEGLTIAVILSAAAIEAHANDMIRRLDDEATIEAERRGKPVIYDRSSMERGLSLEEKLTLVGPLLTGTVSIKGTTAWEAFRRVVPLRNDLLHVKSPAVAENDPDNPSPYGRLLLGAGSTAPEDAARVIHAVEPGWIPKEVATQLGIIPDQNGRDLNSRK